MRLKGIIMGQSGDVVNLSSFNLPSFIIITWTGRQLCLTVTLLLTLFSLSLSPFKHDADTDTYTHTQQYKYASRCRQRFQ